MSTTPEMKWKRDTIHSGDWAVWLDAENGNSIRVTGPSREAVASKILSMERVAAALRNVIEPYGKGDENWQIVQARAALTAYEGGGK